MKQLRDYLWLNHQTKVRFVLVGIWNTILGYIAFVAFDYLLKLYLLPRYVAYISAAILSNVMAVTNAFFFHKHLTFKSKTKGLASFYEFIRFYITNIFSTILYLILLPIFVELFKFEPKIAAALTTMLLTVVSYVGHNQFSFRQEESATAEVCRITH